MGLKTNGLAVPRDFPTAPYEAVHEVVVQKCAQHDFYEHFSGSWNAVAYRFRASVDDGDAFVASLVAHGSAPKPEERYQQERALFGLFSNAFSAFESVFYGLFTLGAFITPAAFPLSSPKEQQQVSPTRTNEAFNKAFAGDPILTAFAALFKDPAFQQCREIRNILTHRTAPGRRLYVSVGADDAPPAEWKLNNIPIGASIATGNRADLARLLGDLLTATSAFVAARLR